MNKKYFAVSDIHGRKISIKDFEEKGFEINNENHFIVILGDSFDRGIFNKEIYLFLNKMQSLLKNRFININGNHDDFFKTFIKNIKTKNIDMLDFQFFITNGGDSTINSFFEDEVLKKEMKEYLDDQRNIKKMTNLEMMDTLLFIRDYLRNIFSEKQENIETIKMLEKYYENFVGYYETKKYVFSHAGFNLGRIVNNQNPNFITRGIEFKEDKKTFVIGHMTFESLLLLYPKEVYYDEDKKIVLNHRKNIIGIDNNSIPTIKQNIIIFEE